jgi:hypothetical protein
LNTNRKLYNTNEKLYNTNGKLYNTNGELYNTNGKDQILQRLTCHTHRLRYIIDCWWRAAKFMPMLGTTSTYSTPDFNGVIAWTLRSTYKSYKWV